MYGVSTFFKHFVLKMNKILKKRKKSVSGFYINGSRFYLK